MMSTFDLKDYRAIDLPAVDIAALAVDAVVWLPSPDGFNPWNCLHYVDSIEGRCADGSVLVSVSTCGPNGERYSLARDKWGNRRHVRQGHAWTPRELVTS